MSEPVMSEPATGRAAATVVIDRLGAQGDGIAGETGGEGSAPLYVPFALPGEIWAKPDPATSSATGQTGGGRLTLLANPNPARVAPLCRHFGTCGGCVAQHMAAPLYAAWKRDAVAEAFRQRGLDAEVASLRTILPHSRRRATLSAVRTRDGLVFGYHARASHDICDIVQCPVLDPRLEAALPNLRAICGLLLLDNDKAGEARVSVTLAKHGLDVALTGAFRKIDAQTRLAVVQQAQSARIQRLTANGEPVLAGAAPLVTIAGVDVALPDTAFLQAVAEAEAVILRLVVEGAGAPATTKASVLDLFCGLGTFTFALAKVAPVFALDGDASAIAALTAASTHLQAVKPIEARRRDLFREPLSTRELDAFDIAVLDPPRAGAAAQVHELARSKVRRVVMVSCNPATMARDCAVLVAGGYKLGVVTPIDQFVFSAHVEAVAVLTR